MPYFTGQNHHTSILIYPNVGISPLSQSLVLRIIYLTLLFQHLTLTKILV